MNVRNCRNCGRIFNYLTGIVICPACRDALEAKFQEVKEYVSNHRGAGIAEVAEACNVEAAQIRQWLRDERLEVTEDSAIFLTCEGCGGPIRSGRYCESCGNAMKKGFREAMRASRTETTANPSGDKATSAKMRFL